jgi:hypothetical protein
MCGTATVGRGELLETRLSSVSATHPQFSAALRACHRARRRLGSCVRVRVARARRLRRLVAHTRLQPHDERVALVQLRRPQ